MNLLELAVLHKHRTREEYKSCDLILFLTHWKTVFGNQTIFLHLQSLLKVCCLLINVVFIHIGILL